MKTITIKLEPGEYTDLRQYYEEHDLLAITGARGAGKSYPTAKRVSKILINKPESKFIYMRIMDRELATFAGWCQDLELRALSAYAHNTNLKRGKPHRGDILLEGMDEDGKLVFERIIAKCMSLESSHIYKSGKYDEFDAVVFEEYAHLNMNPVVEKKSVINFLENVETIFRNRPKHIYLMANNLRTLPLIERVIDEETGITFKNPLKIKIFRKSPPEQKVSKFRQYINGELYNEDEFIPRIVDFMLLYADKEYALYIHKVYPRKFYVQCNAAKVKKVYHELDYLSLKLFCQQSANNEFYFQNKKVEATFTSGYTEFVNNVMFFISEQGHRFLV